MPWHKTPNGLNGLFFGKQISVARVSGRSAFPYRAIVDGVPERDLPNSGYARTMGDAKQLAMDYLQKEKEESEAKADAALLTAPMNTDGETKKPSLSMSPSVTAFYIAGTCKTTPGTGAGGWGVIALHNGALFADQFSGGTEVTTCNKMELVAALEAARRAHPDARVSLYMDSKYVFDGITKWIDKWKQNGWKSSTNTPIKNVFFWKMLDEERRAKQIHFELAPRDGIGRQWGDQANALAIKSSDDYVDASMKADQ